MGDYTRRLADECAARGHDCTVIALHDPHVSRMTDLTTDQVRLIRLPAAEAWPERLACAGRHLQRLAPDWVSWQLVAYSFRPRGFLPAALLQYAPQLRGPHCHVMLHELWLGLEGRAGWRARAIGWLQRRGVLCLLEQLDPDCLHTSNAAYQIALDGEGFEVELLALFGNVPVADKSSGPANALTRWLPPAADGPGAAPLVALTFGTLHPQWQPAATVDWLHATARRHERPPVLVAVGRTGAQAASMLDVFRRNGVPVAVTGELAAPEVSQILQSADCGIALHPWMLIGKSGAAAAMLEHGLPVLVPRDDWHLRGAPALPSAAADPLLARLAGLDAPRTDRWLATRRAPESGLAQTADALLQAWGCSLPQLDACPP